MSILQSNSGAVSERLQSLVQDKPADVEWPAYIESRSQLEADEEERLERELARKRATALDYLGKRHQRLDGYSKVESRVFTPEFVSELGQANSTRRAQRNPTLVRMLHGSSSEETIFEDSPNVVPFGPAITPDAKRGKLSS